MHIKIEHLVIFALLLPFGLRGMMNIPAIDILLIVMVFTFLPALNCYVQNRSRPGKLGQLALNKNLLTNADVAQILYCQKHCGEKFGEVAIKRNFMDAADVYLLLEEQAA